MKILFTGVYSHLYGGLERFAERAKAALEAHGHVVDAAGDPPSEAGGYDFVLMQKIPPTVEALRRLKAQCGERLHFYAHDHEAYCLRRHYYDPLRRNCDRTYSFLPCRLCAAVTRPGWILRALTRDMIAFRDELKTVKAFVPTTYIKVNLVQNGWQQERVKVLPPLFVRPDAPRADFMPDGRLRILFMGQLIAGKGVQVLIDAMGFLKCSATLTIVGTGRDEAKLRKSAASAVSTFNLQSSTVNFEGWQEDAQRYFKAADVCVVPSLWNEPYGTVGAEALAHGVPVVCFDVGGLSDWLKPGQTGLFPVAPDGRARTAAARTPACLAAALEKIADPGLLAKMSANAVELVRNQLDPDRFIAELLDFGL